MAFFSVAAVFVSHKTSLEEADAAKLRTSCFELDCWLVERSDTRKIVKLPNETGVKVHSKWAGMYPDYIIMNKI